MTQPDFGPLDKALDRAASLGATDAEACMENEVGLSVRVFDAKVEKFSFSESRGIGLRVYLDGRQGRSYTSDLSDKAIDEAVVAALDSAKVTPADEARALPDSSL